MRSFKSFHLIIILLSAIKLFGQDPNIFNREWKLKSMSYQFPHPLAGSYNAPLSPPIILTIGNAPNYALNTSSCSQLSANLQYGGGTSYCSLTNYMFNQVNCELDFFENLYFIGLWNSAAYYDISLQNPTTLAITRVSSLCTAIYRSEALDVSDSERDKIVVFPNPATEFISIQTNDSDAFEEVLFYNLYGELCMRKNVKQVNDILDVRSLPKGIYIIEIQGRNRTRKQKLIKL